MKLAKRLESQLNKFFIASVSLGVIVLSFNTYLSVFQAKDNALGFITSHVKQISVGEVNSQNISEIDREVNRLYQAWKGTQEIDVRIDVLLDDKLVGHAGQLQEFGFPSFETHKSYPLSSGQELKLHIDLDLTKRLQMDFLLFLTYITFLGGCFLLLRKGLGRTVRAVTTPLEKRVSWLSEIARGLPNSVKGNLDFQDSCIDELQALDASLVAFMRQIILLEKTVAATSFDHGRVKMAEQLAHDLKGSLAILQLRINNSANLTENEKTKLLAAVEGVSSTSRRLLKSRKEQESDVRTVIDLRDVISNVVAQKKEALPQNKKLSILYKFSDSQLMVAGQVTDLQSVFSNIIDNSVEAIDGSGAIEVSILATDGKANVTVKDNGKGIPGKILPHLMEEGATFGKTNGNGLGLFYARTTIEDLGGHISLSSKEGIGTEVQVTLPISQRANSVPTAITLIPGQLLIVVDDDPLIHQTWKIKLGDSCPVKMINLYSIQEFENWIQKNGPGEFGSRFFLIDFDLKDKDCTGLSLIKKYNLSFESLLVTGMAGDNSVIKMCKDSNVKLVSKSEIVNFQFDFVNPSKNEDESLQVWN